MTAKAMTKLFFSFFTLKKANTDLNISFIERYIDDFTTLCFTYYVHVFVSFPKQMCKFGDKKQYNIWIGFGVYTHANMSAKARRKSNNNFDNKENQNENMVDSPRPYINSKAWR